MPDITQEAAEAGRRSVARRKGGWGGGVCHSMIIGRGEGGEAEEV